MVRSKGPFRKFNVAGKRKLVAKGGGGVRKLIHTFWHGPGDVDFKRSYAFSISGRYGNGNFFQFLLFLNCDT